MISAVEGVVMSVHPHMCVCLCKEYVHNLCGCLACVHPRLEGVAGAHW